MRVTLIMVLIIFSSQICKSTNEKKSEEIKNDFSVAEVIITDFSKKMMGYLPDMKVPTSFNTTEYTKLLKENYPDQSKVNLIFDHYKVLVKPLNDKFFSVILCSKDGAHKKMEDLACTLSKVDYRYWDKPENSQPACSFETTWKSICH